MGICTSRQTIRNPQYNERISVRNIDEPQNHEEVLQQLDNISNLSYTNDRFEYDNQQREQMPINTSMITIRIVRPSNILERLETFAEIFNNIETEFSNITPTDINKYKTYLCKHQTEKTCTICLENFKIGESITQLPCKHYFHKECLSKWFSLKNICPLCKLKC